MYLQYTKKTKSFMVGMIVALAFGVIICASPAKGTMIEWTLGAPAFSGYDPQGVIDLLINDYDTPGAVDVTVTSGLVGSEFMSELYLNIDDSFLIPDLDFVISTVSISGALVEYDYGYDKKDKLKQFKADGDGYYDILLQFPTANNDTNRFDGTDQLVFTITADGLTASSLAVDSAPGGDIGPFYAAAHIQGIGEDGELSGWVAPNPVPEPATMLLLGFGLIGIVGLKKRFMQ